MSDSEEKHVKNMFEMNEGQFLSIVIKKTHILTKNVSEQQVVHPMLPPGVMGRDSPHPRHQTHSKMHYDPSCRPQMAGCTFNITTVQQKALLPSIQKNETMPKWHSCLRMFENECKVKTAPRWHSYPKMVMAPWKAMFLSFWKSETVLRQHSYPRTFENKWYYWKEGKNFISKTSKERYN